MRIVDIHTHFFGPVFFRSLAASAHPGGDPEPGLTRLGAAGIEVIRDEPEAHAARWVREMDRNGVERMVSFASLAEEAASVTRACAATNGRLIPFALVDPTAPGAAARVASLAGEHGVRGLLLFPAMHRFLPSDPDLDPVFAEAERHRLPIIAHMGLLRIPLRDVLGLPGDFDLTFANPMHLVPAARRHPGIRFLVPHFGGGYFRETLMAAAQCETIAVDTSSSNSWIRLQPGRLSLAEVLRQALDVLGPERIHFGTDSSTFPRGWRHDLFAIQQTAMMEAGIGAAEQQRIFAGNSAELLGLEPLPAIPGRAEP